MGPTRLVVDGRYRDLSGIGRYAREVISRLGVEHQMLNSSSNPTAPFDMFLPQRRRLTDSDLLYSPGFAAGPSRALQIVTIHDLLHVTHPRPGVGRLHRLCYNRVIRPVVLQAGDVITVSSCSARAISDWVGESVRVHNCGNAASEAFRPDGPVACVARPYLLFVGNLKPHKRPRLALEILAMVDGLDLIMVVPNASAAQELVDLNGLTSRVHIRSHISDSDLASLYRGASALVFTSEWEGYGLPVLESIRCGTPVICDAACESAAEIAVNDPSSVVLPVESSVQAWAEAVSSLMSRGLRSNASREWLDQLSWDAVAANVAAVLTRAMAKMAQP